MNEPPEISLVVPARDEGPNLDPLVEELGSLLDAGLDAEVIVVDDGSADDTAERLRELAARHPWLRAFRLEPGLGQSAALLHGIRVARGRFIGTLDADLQNVPSDLVSLLAIVKSGQADLAQGVRERRADPLPKRIASWVGWRTRRLLLGDVTRDTGCTARVMTAGLARALRLELAGLHRFIPVYARALGARVVEVPVKHRPRARGRTKYGLLDRGAAGLVDCVAVRWMLARLRDPEGRARPLP